MNSGIFLQLYNVHVMLRMITPKLLKSAVQFPYAALVSNLMVVLRLCTMVRGPPLGSRMLLLER